MQPSLRLLESPSITVADKHYDLLAHKPVCLLVYLAYQGTWVSREVLASLFWPEEDEASARHNLRMLLSRAKQLPWAKELESESTRLRWHVQSDVSAFREAVARGEWERVASLHRAPLLDSWRLTDMPGVEEWLELEREALLSAWREAVLKHSRTLSQAANHAGAAEFLRELLKHDPLAEDVLAAYLENAYLAGQRDEALKAYESFKVLLAKELELAPMQETEALAETIRRAETVQHDRVDKREPTKVPLTVLRPPKLIGRGEEQRLLENSSSSVVLVSGEPGVGKSRFLAEVMPKARWLRCREGLENVPYFPLAEHLRNNAATLPELGPYRSDLARLVPEVLPSAVANAPDPQTAKVRLSEALALVLESAVDESQNTPVIFEDIQWADSATLEFVVFLAVRGKVKIYGSYRSSEMSEGLAATLKSLRGSRLLDEVKLEPLSNEDVRDLLANLIGTKQGPDKFSGWLARRSGGNPFFALETLKSLFETGLLESRDGNWHSRLDDITQDYSELDVPERISEVIERRLARLSEATRRVLQAASVMRQGFTPKVLAQVVGLSEWGVVEALESAETNNLTHGETFQHDLLRQSIYADLPIVRRKLLHAQVATTLADQAESIIVAEHYALAGELDKAAPFYLQAADDYVAKGLHGDAKGLLEKIIRLTKDATKLELQTQLATICVELGAHAEAEALLATLFQEALTPNLHADALFAKAALLFHQGQLAQVADILVELSELELDLSERDQYQFTFLRSQVAFYGNQFAEAKKLLEPLLSQLRRKTPSQELVKTLTDIGVACDELGQHQEAAKHLREAMRVAKAMGARHLQVVVAINLLWSAVTAGNVKPVLAEAEEALSLGEYAATMTLRNNLARAYFSLSQDAEARHHYETITGSSQDPTLLSIAWARLAELYQRSKEASKTKKALSDKALVEALTLLSQTEFSVAHLSVGMAVAKYGSDAQVKQVTPYVEGQLGSEAGRELREALATRSKQEMKS